MQAVTQLPFMQVMSRLGGPDYFVTEYFRVYDGYQIENNILRSITANDTGRPVYAQLIGQHIPSLVKTSLELLAYPTAGIDLNLGCPAPVVCRKDAGGGLLRRKDHLNRILEAMRAAIDGRFTVKTRLGFEQPDEFADLLELFAQHGLDTLTIHGRTVKERYQTPVHPELIRLAVDTMDCPVIANGNVVDVATGVSLHQQTEAAGLMIGRGAIRNPWIFNQLRAHYLDQAVTPVTRADLLHYIMLLDDAMARSHAQLEPHKHINHLKKFLVYIAQGLDSEFEFKIRRVSTRSDFQHICHSFLDNPQVVPSLPPVRSKLFCGFDALL